MALNKATPPAVIRPGVGSGANTKPPRRTFFSFNNSSFYNKKNFLIISSLVGVAMLLMSPDFGVNGDEQFQVDYSKKLWSYYATGGKDTAALHVPETNMQWYGGLFDLTAITINKLLGLDDEFNPAYHQIRRILCAIFGFITLIFTSLFAKRIGGWPLAFFTMLLMVCTPRFIGDSMVNPKDIPFAAGYMMALYFISKFIQELPKPGYTTILGFMIGVMIALNTRAGGLLLLIYLFLFVGVFLIRSKLIGLTLTRSYLTATVIYTLVTAILAYGAGIIFWPFALVQPLTHPLQALTEFTHQPITISILFSGLQMSSAVLPWNYIPEWIIRTIPIFSIVGIFFFFRLLGKRSPDLPFLELFMLFFVALFPIGYAVYKHSTLHDGWRHFLFVYPSISIIASVGWLLWFTSFRSKYFNLISLLFLFALLAEDLSAMVRYHPYQYAYFNPLFGGIKKAYGNFETDYWMLSVKEAAAWLKSHEKIDISDKPVTVTTNCYYPASVYLKDSIHQVKVTYTRYYERNQKDWDYAIFYSRFVLRDQLLNHSWPPKGTIYTVKADGIPLCAVVRRDNREDYLGYQALQQNNAPAAIRHFITYLQYEPYNESVTLTLARLYKDLRLFERAEEMVRLSLKIIPGSREATALLEAIQSEKLDGSH